MMAPPRPSKISLSTIHDPLLEGFLDDFMSLDSPRSPGGGSRMTGGAGGGLASPDTPTQTNVSGANNGGIGNSGNGGAFDAFRPGDGFNNTRIDMPSQSQSQFEPSSPSPTHWRLSNPVHMEIQENAKLPIFHWPVDRSGSSIRRDSMPGLPYSYTMYSNRGTASENAASDDNRHQPQQQQQAHYSSTSTTDARNSAMADSNQNDSDDTTNSNIGNKDDDNNDVSLAEMFLSCSHRQSYHANYQSAGALKRTSATDMHLTSRGRSRSRSRSNSVSTWNSTYNSNINNISNANPQQQQQQQAQQPVAILYSRSLDTDRGGGGGGDATANVSNDSSDGAYQGSGSTFQDPLDLLAAEVEPTPLSEIRHKYEVRHRHQSYGGYYPPPYSSTTTTTATNGNSKPPYTSNNNVNGLSRAHQRHPHVVALPIPAHNHGRDAAASPESQPAAPSPVQSHTVDASTAPGPAPAAENRTMQAPEPSAAATFPSPLANAVATAAAIVTQTNTTTAASCSNGGGRSQPPPLTLPPGPYASAQQQRPNSAGPRLGGIDDAGATTTSTTTTLTMNGYTSTNNNTNTTTTMTIPSALERASRQKAQYGFGPKHVVPSVPLPPNKRRAISAGSANRRSASNSPLPSANNSTNNSARTSPFLSGIAEGGGGDRNHHNNDYDGQHPDGGNQGEAYERKKQRAKVARVKLNESIERLSIAIHLAGSQSKQRKTQWQSLPLPPTLSPGEDGSNVAQQQHQQQEQQRQASYVLLSECTQIAESAKKWDRPSFVGAAASLIQGLNAQCEHLMQELMACQEAAAAGVTNTAAPPQAETPTNGSSKRAACDDSNGGGASKRMRGGSNENGYANVNGVGNQTEIDLTDDNEQEQEVVEYENEDRANQNHPIFGVQNLVTRVSRFLDPPSLVRCFQVSKSWKRAFARQESWQDMAIERFGPFNVRQWKGKLEDEDEGIACLPVTLYRSMNAANVMPHVSHEGMFLLGEARLPNKVSAWTFLVERSNGETLRSVKRKEPVPGAGMFASMPVVGLRTVIQNTGVSDEPVVIREQLQTVDASTRRRGVEMVEINWDDRFRKRLLNLDGKERPPESQSSVKVKSGSSLDVCGILCQLKLFEAVVIETYIHAKGCSTTSKFIQRSNFTKILVQLQNGTTVPLVVPFPRDISHHLEH